MKHRFKHTCYDPVILLSGCVTLHDFMKRLTTQSLTQPDMWEPETYRGDGFEAFCEVLINCSPIDKRINLVEYEPWDYAVYGPDNGVDGIGKSHDGKIHTVQIKFRNDVKLELTANEDHLSNFVAKSFCMYPGQIVDMTVYTTALGVRQDILNDMYHGLVRVLGYAQIAQLVDNNLPFWNLFYQEMTCNNNQVIVE